MSGSSDGETFKGKVEHLQEVLSTKERYELPAALIEASPDAMIVVNEDGLIVLANFQAELMFGYHRSELMGKQIEVLLPERVHAAHLKHRTGYMNTPRIRQMGQDISLAGRRKNGAEISVEIMLSPVVTTGGMFVIAVIRRKLVRTGPPSV